MPDDLQIRSIGTGKFGIYNGDELIVSNLDSKDVVAFKNGHESIHSSAERMSAPKVCNHTDSLNERGAGRKGRGRKLLLAPYADIIHDMIKDNPHITLKEIEIRLNKLNIRFSSPTAIVNLMRKYALRTF